MKHEIIIAARNLARFIPITVIACLFTYIASKTLLWPAIVAGAFTVFWGLSTIADVRYRNAIKAMMHGDRHAKH